MTQLSSARGLADLAASGIDASVAKRLGIAPVPTPFGPAKDDYRIPYFESDGRINGFYRDKHFDAPKKYKYTQAKGAKSRLYLPPLLSQTWAEIQADASIALIITEGEKKTVCGCLHGFPTVGVGGVDAWSSHQRPIPDFDAFKWEGRHVAILYDSDAATKPQVRRARDKLANELRRRGAIVRIMDLPPPPKGTDKVGLDTLLVAHGKDALIAVLADPNSAVVIGSRGERNTDFGNARRFVARHGSDVRFVADLGKFIVWEGNRWQVDHTGAVMRRAKETARSIYAEAAELPDDADAAQRKAKAQWATTSESSNRLQAMIELAKSESGMTIRAPQLDADSWLLGCPNGTVDLRTGALRESRREDFITKQVAIAYDASAKAPTWLTFLDRIFAGDRELIAFIRRAIGYSLTGDTSEQCFFIEWGTGDNGKSTKLRCLKELFGDYATQTRAETLMARDRSGASGDIAQLQGTRLVAASETESNRRLAEALVKTLTGQDTISARYMYQELFEFSPQFKIWLAANHRPEIRGTDHAIWRRIRLIPFTVRIPDTEKDKELPTKLRADWPGILAWAVKGCIEWQRQGLGAPKAVIAATNEYRSEMDVLGRWLDEAYERTNARDREKDVAASDLYHAYKRWAEANNESAMTSTAFGRRVKEMGVGSYASKTGVKYLLRSPRAKF